MFFRPPEEPTKLKKAVYFTASVILGLLLSFLIHAFAEINYLQWADRHGYAVNFFGGCVFWPWFKISLLVLGAVGGFFLGRFWWRKIYIEKVWAKNRR
jgi:hypothetical protein